MVLGIGYLAGLLLSALALPVNVIIWTIFRTSVCRLAGIKLNLPKSPLRAHAEVYRYIDLLKKTDGTAGAVLTKMEATAALSDNLLCAAIAIGIAYTLGINRFLISQEWTIILLPILLVVVILRRGTLLARLAGFLKVWNIKTELDATHGNAVG
jgi:hypothetical protein